MPIQVGVVGKPNTGKSTLFAAATLTDVKRAPYPFTTIDPNIGIGYVRVKCVCKEIGVKDNPRNSICIDGWRFIPVELIDVAGLVPEAWKGRGLGNRFLDHLRRASVLIHVIDASGGTDEEGRPVKPGTYDPAHDIEFLERELDMWMFQIISKDWEKISKIMDINKNYEELFKRFSGLEISREKVLEAIERLGLFSKRVINWTQDDILSLIREVRRKAKPIVIAANKADIDIAEDNIKRLQKEFGKRYKIIPTSAESELALRRAAKAGLIKYLPGDSDFEVIGQLTKKQEDALEYIRNNVLQRYGSTGVQQVINTAVLDELGMIAVFPVENDTKFTDHKGNVLPDVYLVPKDTTAKEFAYKIHTDLGEKFAFAIDALTKKRISAEEKLYHRMVIKIITSR
ncbi:MAG: redox-regulated ATPase YchF [Thermoprotei archaeon]|nr:MAG: redox-regulated ATPase YchF [Thermoprotei archaeon]